MIRAVKAGQSAGPLRQTVFKNKSIKADSITYYGVFLTVYKKLRFNVVVSVTETATEPNCAKIQMQCDLLWTFGSHDPQTWENDVHSKISEYFVCFYNFLYITELKHNRTDVWKVNYHDIPVILYVSHDNIEHFYR